MTEGTLISYVVTAYNIEKYIQEAVQCAFDQTYTPLEIVLSDDCSTDSTFDIMKRMAEDYHGPHKVVLNRNDKNLGITKHMNKAYLELSEGEIIIAAHGDDLSQTDRTEKSFQYLKKYPDTTALSFSIDAFDDNGNLLKQHSAIVDEQHEYTFKNGGNIPAPSRAFYKSVMETFGPLNDDCPTEDELISFRSLLLGKNRFFPEHMVRYRKHKRSSSNAGNFNRFPLDKIIKQQNDDMIKAVELGLITEEQRIEKYKQLSDEKEIREKYRSYISRRTTRDLVELVLFRKVSGRRKLHYIKEHIEYLLDHHK